MKEKIHYVIEAVLAVAVIFLFVLQFSGNKKSTTANVAVTSGNFAAGDPMPIAFIDVDSLMSNYIYSIDLNEQITKKYENSRASLTEKLRKLQTEVTDFQRKVDTGSFLSTERLEAEQQRLMKKDQDLQELQAQMSQELGEEQLRMNKELRKTIILQLQEFNKSKGYQIVYGKMNDNILYADNTYDITGEVIEFLNRHYASSPSAAKTDE
ncbi:MAG: OmpH family outer membrane protein [Tannerella sp.]|jgi:outer membrane protein|nr:OmpH family outer membrane protein [Tannerella sp.]